MKRKMPKFKASLYNNSSDKAASIRCEHTVADDEVTLRFEDIIGSYWDETRAADISPILAEARGRPVKVVLNSVGGSVFDGIGIYNKLNAYRGKVTTVIEGSAMSAAFIIALAGDSVMAYDNVSLMAHRAWTISLGNTHEMAEEADILAKIDDSLAKIIAARTGASQAQALQWLDGEGKRDGTWFSAEEALEAGLIDEVIPSGRDSDEPEDVEDRAKKVRAEAVQRVRVASLQIRLRKLDIDDYAG